jgi:hypothetical protein
MESRGLEKITLGVRLEPNTKKIFRSEGFRVGSWNGIEYGCLC